MNDCPTCRGCKPSGVFRHRINSKYVQITSCKECNRFTDDESAAVYVSAMEGLRYERHNTGHYIVQQEATLQWQTIGTTPLAGNTYTNYGITYN